MLQRRIFFMATIAAIAISIAIFMYFSVVLKQVQGTAATHGGETESSQVKNLTSRESKTTQSTRLAGSKDSKSTDAHNSKEGSKSLPPPCTPLKDIMAELKQLAETGDVSAASRLAVDARSCVRAKLSKSFLNNPLNNTLDVNNNNKSPLQIRQITSSPRDIQWNNEVAQKMNAIVAANSVMCDGLSEEDLDLAYSSTLLAAQLGDPKEADCYVGSYFSMVFSGLLNHPEWLSDYQNNALELAQRGIQNGDWIMARLLAEAYSGNDRGRFLSQVTGADPVLAYRYLKLWTMGLQSNNSDNSYFNELLAAAMRKISVDDKVQADAWAQDTYQNHFNSTPNAPSGLNLCSTN